MENEKMMRLKDALNRLRLSKGFRTQNELAVFLKKHPSTLSSALSGDPRYLTDSLIEEVELAVKQSTEPKPQGAPDIVIPAATAKMYSDMAESIRILSEIVSAYQKGDIDGNGTHLLKNNLYEQK